MSRGEATPLLPSSPRASSCDGRWAVGCGCSVLLAVGLLVWLGPMHPATVTPPQLSNAEECRKLGFSDTFMQSRRQTLFLAPKSFLPLLATHNLHTKVDTSVESALIWLHGLNGDANTYFCNGLAALKAEGANNVIGIAPWFGNESISGLRWDSSSHKRRSVFWTNPSWLTGGDDVQSISNSFQIIDQLVDHLLDSSIFPHMKRITLAGFSAGGQLLSRWAFFSQRPLSSSVRSIVGDPGTLLYFNSLRPHPLCSPLTDTGPSHVCDTFLPVDPHACPGADLYKYGVNLSAVTHHSYLLPFQNDPSKLTDAIQHYGFKDIRYLFGHDDVCNCNAANFTNRAGCVHAPALCQPNLFGPPGCCDTYPDSEVNNAVDSDCAGMMQGSNRLQRGLNYMSYLASSAFGGPLQPPYAVFMGGHDMRSCYNDPQFRAWAYPQLLADNISAL